VQLVAAARASAADIDQYLLPPPELSSISDPRKIDADLLASICSRVLFIKHK